jgi:hypothetical protein
MVSSVELNGVDGNVNGRNGTINYSLDKINTLGLLKK